MAGEFEVDGMGLEGFGEGGDGSDGGEEEVFGPEEKVLEGFLFLSSDLDGVLERHGGWIVLDGGAQGGEIDPEAADDVESAAFVEVE
jgi:hypothetical protein